MSREGWIAELGGRDKSGFFRRNHYLVMDNGFLEKRKEYVRKMGNTDVYQCAYCYENEQYDTCAIMADPYLDFDMDNIEENYGKLVRSVKYSINYIGNSMGIPAEELRIYFSGSKGFHIIVPGEAAGIVPAPGLNEDLKHFAAGIAYLSCGRNEKAVANSAVDLGIYDRKRLFRLPNSVNSKSGLYKVPVTVDQLYGFSFGQLKEWASRPRFIKFRKATFRSRSAAGYREIMEVARHERKRNRKRMMSLKEGERMELLPCTQALMGTAVEKGNRNHSCFALASSLLQAGYQMEEVYEAVEEWNGRNAEPLGEREVEVTVGSAISSVEFGKVVGCGKYKDLGYCQEDCKLMGGKKNVRDSKRDRGGWLQRSVPSRNG